MLPRMKRSDPDIWMWSSLISASFIPIVGGFWHEANMRLLRMSWFHMSKNEDCFTLNYWPLWGIFFKCVSYLPSPFRKLRNMVQCQFLTGKFFNSIEKCWFTKVQKVFSKEGLTLQKMSTCFLKTPNFGPVPFLTTPCYPSLSLHPTPFPRSLSSSVSQKKNPKIRKLRFEELILWRKRIWRIEISRS